ncbi:hypothetical protein Vafri_19171, partial [Volvox africanus]
MLKRCTSTGRVQRMQVAAITPAQTPSNILQSLRYRSSSATAMWPSPRCCRLHNIRVVSAASHRRQYLCCALTSCSTPDSSNSGSSSGGDSDGGVLNRHTGSRCQFQVALRRHLGCSSPRLAIMQHGFGFGFGSRMREGYMSVTSVRRITVACMPSSSGSGSHQRRGGKRGGSRRSPKPDSATPAPTAGGATAAGNGGNSGATSLTSGPAPSAAFSPVPALSAIGGGSSGASSGGKGVTTAATRGLASAGSSAALAVATRSLDGSDSDYEAAAAEASNTVGGNIVPFARRQPRALVLDCAYRPINVLTWYKAFHFDYFGKVSGDWRMAQVGRIARDAGRAIRAEV